MSSNEFPLSWKPTCNWFLEVVHTHHHTPIITKTHPTSHPNHPASAWPLGSGQLSEKIGTNDHYLSYPPWKKQQKHLNMGGWNTYDRFLLGQKAPFSRAKMLSVLGSFLIFQQPGKNNNLMKPKTTTSWIIDLQNSPSTSKALLPGVTFVKSQVRPFLKFQWSSTAARLQAILFYCEHQEKNKYLGICPPFFVNHQLLSPRN